MNNSNQKAEWHANVILVDADYIDKVAFDLIVNFERMLGRPIDKADMARWADCVALDGGIRPGENPVQVILIHTNSKQQMDNFEPSRFATDLTNKAFKDHIGEFIFDIDALQLIASQKDVKRIMVIPNAEDDHIYNKVREALKRLDDDSKHITVFAMQPMPGGNFQQEILGYSLMAALGIKSDEINNKMK